MYMHTSLSDPGIFVIFEVCASAVDDSGNAHETACGWGFRKLFKQDAKLIDVSDSSPAPTTKYATLKIICDNHKRRYIL